MEALVSWGCLFKVALLDMARLIRVRMFVLGKVARLVEFGMAWLTVA